MRDARIYGLRTTLLTLLFMALLRHAQQKPAKRPD